jgi:hypothetical protein
MYSKIGIWATRKFPRLRHCKQAHVKNNIGSFTIGLSEAEGPIFEYILVDTLLYVLKKLWRHWLAASQLESITYCN